MIAVLSPAYLQARFPQPEWAAAFAADPEGAQRALLPVMVQECHPDGLPSQVVQIRVHKLDADEAANALLEGVKTGRAKPSTRPPFPGRSADTADPTATVQAAAPALRWQRLSAPIEVTWRVDLDNGLPNHSRREAVELHLVPVGDSARLQVRELSQLRDVLPDFGRQHRIFSPVEALDARADATTASVVSMRYETSSGIAVTRSGQRSTWTALPRGQMCAILDEDHLAGQLQAMLRVLASLPLPNTELVVPVVGIEPAMMITVGKVSGPPSNTATFGHGMPKHIRPAHEDALGFASLSTHAATIGGELAARLTIEHRTAAGLR